MNFLNLLKVGVMRENFMAHKSPAVHYVLMDIVNPDSNLETMPEVLSRLRKKFLDHEPGTEAQDRAYKLYNYYLKLFQSGQAYLPKF